MYTSRSECCIIDKEVDQKQLQKERVAKARHTITQDRVRHLVSEVWLRLGIGSHGADGDVCWSCSAPRGKLAHRAAGSQLPVERGCSLAPLHSFCSRFCSALLSPREFESVLVSFVSRQDFQKPATFHSLWFAAAVGCATENSTQGRVRCL